MDGADIGTLTTILTSFKGAFYSGVDFLTPYAKGLLAALMTISLVLNHLLNLDEMDHFKALIKEALKFGFFYKVVDVYASWVMGSSGVIGWFVKLGLIGGGSGISEGVLLNPSYIVSLGFKIAQPIDNVLATTSWMTSFGMALGLLSAKFMIIIAVAIMAVQIFITFLEFYILGALAIILIPFGVLKHTSFLGEKALGAIVAAGVKLMVLSFILSVSIPMVEKWTLPGSPTLDNCIAMFISCLCLTFLCWQAPSLAAGLMSGSPVLSGGAVAGTAVAGMSAIALGGATIKGAKDAGSAGLGALRTAAGALGLRATASGAGAAGAGAMGAASNLAGNMKRGDGFGNIVGHARGATPEEASPSGGLNANISHDDKM